MTRFGFKTIGYALIFLSFYFFGLAAYNFLALMTGDWLTTRFIVAVASMFASVWGLRLALLLLAAAKKSLRFR